MGFFFFLNVEFKGIASKRKFLGCWLQDPPVRPKSNESLSMAEMAAENLQLWRGSGESCPEGTVPIRRTTEKDMLRASSLRRFGRKTAKGVRRDFSGSGHEVISLFIIFLYFFFHL